MKKLLLAALAVFAVTTIQAQKRYTVKSPDGRLDLTVTVGSDISYALRHGTTTAISDGKLSMSLQSGTILGANPRLQSAKRSSVNKMVPTYLYRNDSIADNYNQIDMKFGGDFGVIFRVYNSGAAYRFYTTMKNDIVITDERADFGFDKDYMAYIPYSVNKEDPFANSFENLYSHQTISAFEKGRLAFLPLLVELDGGKKLAITESDLESYPGMYLGGEGRTLSAAFAKYPKSFRYDDVRYKRLVTSREDHIAKVKGTRSFPWRVMAVSEKDTELPVNDLVYVLAPVNRIGEYAWVKQGKVAWDWWNDWGITGVDFKAGVNDETYKYYIDFASANGIEYVVLDEGWSPSAEGDIMKVVPEINLVELAKYAEKKSVKLILWAVMNVLDDKLEEACEYYSSIGIKGFKVDFLDRDDQDAVDMVYRLAKGTAKYNMLVNYHGMYKPTGLNRTYPNVVNYEGVYGLETRKWADSDIITYDVTIPYIRMVAGPLDYTPGAMRNSGSRDKFRSIYSDPMSMGTRCHQMALYIVFDSPLTMLCDTPTAYMKEQECTDFIVKVPMKYNETRILAGEVGEYIVTARRVGDDWFIGGITSWNERDVEFDLSFLGRRGMYKAEVFYDGPNAGCRGEDYVRQEIAEASYSSTLKFHMAPGGGFALRLTKIR